MYNIPHTHTHSHTHTHTYTHTHTHTQNADVLNNVEQVRIPSFTDEVLAAHNDDDDDDADGPAGGLHSVHVRGTCTRAHYV